ncbi:MAG: MFS transporter [Thermoplasmata archaeon]|nr:MFS transporter [Thermoplasmata archaeon]
MSAPAPGRAAPVLTGRLAGYRRVFGNRRFLWFFLSQATGDAGYAVYAIAVPWLALRISGSAAIAGLVLGVEFGVYALSFLAGPIVDRVRDLRTVLLVGYPSQGVLALLLGVLAVEGRLTVPVLLVLVVAISWLWDFTWTASNAAPPKVVPPDDLFAANALLSAVSGGNQLAGYAAGAAAILLVGPAQGLILYGLLNFAAAVFCIPVRVPQAGSTGGWYDGLRAGFRSFVRPGERPLVPLATFSAVQGFAGAAPALLILAVANEHATGGATTYGILFTAFAAGTIVGSVALGSANPRAGLGRLLLTMTAVEGLLIAVAVLAAPLGATSAPLWFAVGAADVVFYQVVLVYLQATTAPELVGRTLTNAYLFRGTGRALGAVTFGAVLAVAPLLSTGVGDGVTLVLLAGATALAAPALRRLAF